MTSYPLFFWLAHYQLYWINKNTIYINGIRDTTPPEAIMFWRRRLRTSLIWFKIESRYGQHKILQWFLMREHIRRHITRLPVNMKWHDLILGLVCLPSQVYRHIQVTLGQVTIVTHARDWLELDQRWIRSCHWTLISKGWSSCSSLLYWVPTYINSIILLLQWPLLLYSASQLDSVLRTGLLISKGKLQSLLPYLILSQTIRCLTQFLACVKRHLLQCTLVNSF